MNSLMLHKEARNTPESRSSNNKATILPKHYRGSQLKDPQNMERYIVHLNLDDKSNEMLINVVTSCHCLLPPQLGGS